MDLRKNLDLGPDYIEWACPVERAENTTLARY